MAIIDQPFCSQLTGMLTITKHYKKSLYHTGKMSVTKYHSGGPTTSCQLTEVIVLDFELTNNNPSGI